MATSKTTRQLWKSELVEIKLPIRVAGTPDKFMLGDYQNLRDVFLQGIVAYEQSTMPVSPLSKLPVIPAFLMNGCFLTLEDYNGVQFDQNGPLNDLHTTEQTDTNSFGNNIHQNLPIEYKEQKVSWSKCFITIPNIALISASVEQVIVLRVFYRETMVKEKRQRGAGFKNQK